LRDVNPKKTLRALGPGHNSMRCCAAVFPSPLLLKPLMSDVNGSLNPIQALDYKVARYSQKYATPAL